MLVLLGFAPPAFASPTTATLEVKGWTCGSCAAATKIVLKKVEGVQAVATDFEHSTATVTYDDAKTTAERLIAAVEKAGYKASIAKPVSAAGESEASARSTATGAPTPSEDHLPPERVKFFEVPLGCPAVDGLGCGSRAKPILTELERDPSIAEAWVNHAGTILAVVWKEPGDPKSGLASLEPVFEKHGLDVLALQGSERDAALAASAARANWHRGPDVDRLSEEEARVVAARLVARLVKRGVVLDPERATALRDDLAKRLAQWFVGERPPGQKLDLTGLARTYLDAGQLAEFEKVVSQGFRRLPDDAS